MKLHLLLLPVLVAAVSAPAHAAGSAEAGQSKSMTCMACHGADGNSVNPEWPSIAGQHPSYIVEQLQAFKNDVRQNVLMTPMAKPLSDQDMLDLAAYYSQQKPREGEADPDKLAVGQRIFRGGDAALGVTACSACHGPDGSGNLPASYPMIAGQHATYTAAQLRAYKAGARQTDPNQMMRNVAAALTDEQIDAVASYVQGLR